MQVYGAVFFQTILGIQKNLRGNIADSCCNRCNRDSIENADARVPYRIDVLTSIPGVDFAMCYEKRLETTLDDTTITLIDKDSLIAAKKASARPQDLLDAAKLEE
jgi:hypothetical protein